MGQERQMGWGFGYGRGVFGVSGHASGGAGEPEGSGAPGLIEIVFGKGIGLGGIELGALVEVVGEAFLGDLVVFRLPGADAELGLRRPPWGMEEGR